MEKDKIGTIYLAGGCFWGMEKLMESVPGVVDAVSGYANGKQGIIPTYELVCTGRTGFRETVKVEYDKEKVSLEAILFAFFKAIDPTTENRQGNDRGSQYQSGVYYADAESKKIVDEVVAVEKSRYSNFSVEIKPLENFFEAEERHQDYLKKHPNGYCHIGSAEFREVEAMTIDPAKYKRPSDEAIAEKLTKEEYNVTQLAGTEPPFDNKYWNSVEKGIYVDVVTGEPLFSSRGKYASTCGWPSFYEPIDPNALVYAEDSSHGMERTEVRSRTGNSHLGHVFQGDPHSPNGTRFCINSASLRFIPLADMEREGYGYLVKYIGGEK